MASGRNYFVRARLRLLFNEWSVLRIHIFEDERRYISTFFNHLSLEI